jgi:ArsR family transcriptional regulator, arsenate/arsenite/antimonite-responsive transcriptional repressor
MAESMVINLVARVTGCCSPQEIGLDEAAATAISDDFQLFAHPVRVQLLTIMAKSDDAVCVCDLEAAVAVKQPTVSYHLKLLRDAGLVSCERQGPWAYYTLDRAQLAARQQRIAEYLASWKASS